MPATSIFIFLGGCDVEWIDAKVNKTDTLLDGDDAVVFSLYESDLDNDNDNGTVVTGANAVTMDYIAGSDGKFVGTLLASASLVRDAFYWREVTATPSGGNPHMRRDLVQAKDRTSLP